MGAWGQGSFENDDASDWLCDLENSEDLVVIESALRTVAEAGGHYLESPDCCCALAAAEIVAALRGKPPNGLPESASTWMKGKPMPPDEIVQSARCAVAAIKGSSELQELWAETADFQNWIEPLENLEARLTS